MHTHTRTRTHARTHAHARTHTHTHRHRRARTHARSHARARARTHTHTHAQRQDSVAAGPDLGPGRPVSRDPGPEAGGGGPLGGTVATPFDNSDPWPAAGPAGGGLGSESVRAREGTRSLLGSGGGRDEEAAWQWGEPGLGSIELCASPAGLIELAGTSPWEGGGSAAGDDVALGLFDGREAEQ